MSEILKEIEIFIKKYIGNLENRISLDSITNYDDKKIEMVLSMDNHMISISILLNLTYDLMIVEFESENLIMSKTKMCDNIDDLLQEIREDFKKIIDCY